MGALIGTIRTEGMPTVPATQPYQGRERRAYSVMRRRQLTRTCSNEWNTHTHTHTRLTALCPGLPGWAGSREVKPIWILLKQRDGGWQWHQLGHMQVCTSLQTDNHASTPPLSFFQAGCDSCRPTNSVKAQKAHSNQMNGKACKMSPRKITFVSWYGIVWWSVAVNQLSSGNRPENFWHESRPNHSRFQFVSKCFFSAHKCIEINSSKGPHKCTVQYNYSNYRATTNIISWTQNRIKS